MLYPNINVKAVRIPSSLNNNRNKSYITTQSKYNNSGDGGNSKELNIPRPPRLMFDITSSSNYIPRRSSSFKRQFYTLKKEIIAVKSSLVSLQANHKKMLEGKKQLEQEYQETKKEVTKTLESSTKDLETYNALLNSRIEKPSLELSTIVNCEDDISTSSIIFYDDTKELELFQSEIEKSKKDFMTLINFKEKIELLLEEKEKEYLERLRECEAVTEGQSGMINSMEGLLKELEGKMVRLRNEKQQRKNSLLSSGSNFTLSRRQSYTNPISLFTDEERVRHQSRFGLAKRWVEDDEVSMCQQAGCSVNFNLWNRRHHCRRYSMLLFPDGSEDWGGVWSKVCEGCFKNSK
ncbi:7115_t:CDS:2 [Entrophospora sp. SA101]|nr:7115_t:CDS:2 [Entrophospora sp. SA101]